MNIPSKDRYRKWRDVFDAVIMDPGLALTRHPG